MGKPNHSFEKRRRELEKKKKQEAKRQRKLERKNAPAAEEPDQDKSIPPFTAQVQIGTPGSVLEVGSEAQDPK
ncbi:MAG: hypothetical protein AMJ65_09755 [Phycisphaerae bacterium SG8_4]|nr:MAG: hypothetical protein AMJ65_09755 [Phycisphaerae bacterium SG8_4]